MLRRRPPKKRQEIEFSFDSFLDVVANVIGILLRLILLAWVAGKSYNVLAPSLNSFPELPAEISLLMDNHTPQHVDLIDPDEAERSSLRQAIEQYHRQAEQAERQSQEKREQRVTLLAKDQQVQHRLEALRHAMLRQSVEAVLQQAQAAEKHLQALQVQQACLEQQLQKETASPSVARPLRYQAPVAAEVQTQEVMFECHSERVTPIDIASLLLKAQADARERISELETAWEFTGLTQPVGAFRLRYVVERQREMFDTRATPSGRSFRYGFSRWQLVPEQLRRGETLAEALRESSLFQRIMEQLDPEQVVVTFWVYPDSFALYRGLRDHLHERKYIVAGRPLPMDKPIAASREGSRSRGQ